MGLRHGGLCLVQISQDGDTPRVIGAAAVGQIEPARGALDQGRAKARFQFGQSPADRRFGQAQPLGSATDTAGLDDADEDLHVRKLVHLLPI